MELVFPSITYQNSYLKTLREGNDESSLTRLDAPNPSESFADFVVRLNDYAKGLQLPIGWVPSTELWLVDKNEFIGRVSIRHKLTEHLLKEAGHIGYYIRPSQRKKGYGKKILELALFEARELGLKKVLITCDEDNEGSRKIIEANGGILENIIEISVDRPRKRRYWITL